jgi:hypothetical protein
MFNPFLPIQIILFLFILFAFSRVVLRFRDGQIHFGALLFWLVIWLAAALALFSPEKTTQLAKLAGIGRGVDVITYISLAILFYLVFRLHVLVEGLNTKLSQLIREIALQNSGSKTGSRTRQKEK